MSASAIVEGLGTGGFNQIEWIADWDGRPFDLGSKEIIMIAR
jgi:hypothetical protein